MKKPKGYKPGDHEHNHYLALVGSRFMNDEAAHFATRWSRDCDLLTLKGELKPDRSEFKRLQDYEEFFRNMRSINIKESVRYIRRAIENKDGRFFRRFADFVEVRDQQRDPLRMEVLELCLGDYWTRKDNHYKQIHEFTCRELINAVKLAGVKTNISERHMRIICSELGLRLKSAPRGRPVKIRKSKKV